MRFKRLWLWFCVVWIFSCLLFVGLAYAETTEIVVVTADFALGGNECVSNYGITVVLPDQVQMTWTPAPEGNGTKIIVTYGDEPNNCNDGITVYEGNGSSTTHVVDPDAFAVGVYYRVYTLLEEGNCSSCFSSGMIISQILETGGGDVSIDMSGLHSLTDLGYVGLVLVFGVFFSLVGVLRASITGYVAGVIALILSTVFVWDTENIGVYLGIPLIIIIIGLMGSAVRNAWTEGLRIF